MGRIVDEYEKREKYGGKVTDIYFLREKEHHSARSFSRFTRSSFGKG
jgi:hypothetical protein